jgi:hypothetical protein
MDFLQDIRYEKLREQRLARGTILKFEIKFSKIGSCSFCDQCGHDQPMTSLTSWFCDEFLKNLIFIVTSDQFHVTSD